MINFKNIIVLSIIASSTIFASNQNILVKEADRNKHTNNEIDDKYVINRGWDQYDDEKSKPVLKTKKDGELYTIRLLQKILEENKKQTKIQTKILKILEEQFDPKPKTITVNGKKCIANSSADCFQFPLIPEAKRVPVLADWLKHPDDMQKAVKYLQWQAKYFKHVINIGNSLPLAINQFGNKAYPIDYGRPGYRPLAGYYGAYIIPRVNKFLADTLKDNSEFYFFFGMNTDLDLIQILDTMDIIKDHPKLKFHIVFFDKKSKELLESSVKTVSTKLFNDVFKKVDAEVKPSLFKKFGIYATPSLSILFKDKKDNKKHPQILAVGKIGKQGFNTKVRNYMEYKKLIDYDKLSDYNNWKSFGTRSKDYYLHYYNKKIPNIKEQK